MCVVSMVMDHYQDKWRPRIDPYWPNQPFIPTPTPQPTITPEEIEEFRRLMERAKEYDRRNNEPNCELDSKRQAIKDIAKQLGVEIDFI